MSAQTRQPGGGTQRRPVDRLPRSGSPARRGHEIRVGLLGVLGLIVLVIGIPAALVLFVGYPLPRTAPSRDWLTTAISATLIIKVLACVVWLVWAHFTVCLLTEWRAVRRGRVPSHVALGGGNQLLARRLVAAALLLAGAATIFAHTGVGRASGPTAVATQQVTAAQVPAAQSSPNPGPVRAATHKAQLKYYTVQPPHGRRYDSLWDIADRTLNDPLRYKEIFALNHDRVQADGRKLIDANLIMPGWQLRLPADAAGPGVHTTPAAPKPAVAQGRQQPGANAQTGTSDVANSVVAGAVVRAAGVAATSSTVTATASSAAASPGSQLPNTLLGGGLVLAGLLTALTARRGPYSPAEAGDDALEAGADPALAGLLDKALRHLAVARNAQHRSLPHPVVAWGSGHRIVLSFSGGDIADPPAPWRLGEDARSWDLEAAALPDGPAPDAAAPFPGLLSVGHSDGFELFLDIEHAPGVISVAGDLDRARQLALALAVQAATCRWNDGAKITAVGFGGDDLVQIAPRSIVQVARLSDVLPELEQEHEAVAALQRELGVDGVLIGRQVYRSELWQPRLVLLSGPPTPDEASRLQALAFGRSTTAVLVLGDVAKAPWRFVVDGNGTLDLGSLGVSATAHRLSHEAATELVAMFARADQDRPRLSDEVGELIPSDAAAPAPRAARRRMPVASVSLLGPVTVTAGGPMSWQRRALATEIVVAAALHPDGLHDAVLHASVWPRGVSADVFAATMAGVQAWLGRDESGANCLDQSADGAWRLTDAVRVDWVELQAIAAAATGDRELPALAQAIELFTGEAFSGTAPGRYGWLSFARAAREARVLGTAVARRAATLLTEGHRVHEATHALRKGLTLVPTAEPLWRDLLTLQSWDGPDGAAAVAVELYEVLRAHRIWPEPETDALIAQVAPGFHGNGPTPATPAVAAG